MLEAFYHRHRRLVKCTIAAAVVMLIYIGAGFLMTLHSNYKIHEPREVFLSRFDMSTVKAARVIHSEHPFLYITRGEHPYGSLFGVITDDSIPSAPADHPALRQLRSAISLHGLEIVQRNWRGATICRHA